MEIAVTEDTLYTLPPSRYISVNVTPASWADTGQSLAGGNMVYVSRCISCNMPRSA